MENVRRSNSIRRSNSKTNGSHRPERNTTITGTTTSGGIGSSDQIEEEEKLTYFSPFSSPGPSPSSATWATELKQLFIIRELVGSEKSYLSHLSHLLEVSFSSRCLSFFSYSHLTFFFFFLSRLAFLKGCQTRHSSHLHTRCLSPTSLSDDPIAHDPSNLISSPA